MEHMDVFHNHPAVYSPRVSRSLKRSTLGISAVFLSKAVERKKGCFIRKIFGWFIFKFLLICFISSISLFIFNFAWAFFTTLIFIGFFLSTSYLLGILKHEIKYLAFTSCI